MDICQAPEWIQYAVLGLAVFPHVLTLVPTQYRATASTVFKVLDLVAANYGHCKNAKVVDEQDKTTPRP